MKLVIKKINWHKTYWILWFILIFFIIGSIIIKNKQDFNVIAFDNDEDIVYDNIILSNEYESFSIKGSSIVSFNEEANFGKDFYYQEKDNEIITLFLFTNDEYQKTLKEENKENKENEDIDLQYKSFEEFSSNIGNVLLYSTSYNQSNTTNVIEGWIFTDNSIINISYYFVKDEVDAINDVKTIINNVKKN